MKKKGIIIMRRWSLKKLLYEEAVIPISTMCNTYKRSLVVKIAGLGCKNIVFF